MKNTSLRIIYKVHKLLANERFEDGDRHTVQQ
jgi:hypothetical protein